MTLAMRTAYQLLRLVPGTLALRRNLRDSAWLREADAVVVSFPKSGRTFVRAMLARLYQRAFGIDERQLLEFPVLRRAAPGVPRVLFTHAGDAMKHPDRISLTGYAGRRVVLLARHPADVAVSRYHHLKHRSRDRARRKLARQPLDSFVWTSQGGLPSIIAFLNRFASLPGVTILRFEDFVLDPERSLKELAASIGIMTDSSSIAEAAEFASLANLKEREKEGYFTSSRLRRSRSDDEKSGKVRSGKVGGYRAELSPNVAARVDSYIRENLDPRFGY